MNPCPEGFELVYVPHLQTTVCVPSAIAGLYRRWMGQVNVVAGPRMLDELHEHPDDRPYVWDLPDGP
jgi:hypothetical protein